MTSNPLFPQITSPPRPIPLHAYDSSASPLDDSTLYVSGRKVFCCRFSPPKVLRFPASRPERRPRGQFAASDLNIKTLLPPCPHCHASRLHVCVPVCNRVTKFCSPSPGPINSHFAELRLQLVEAKQGGSLRNYPSRSRSLPQHPP